MGALLLALGGEALLIGVALAFGVAALALGLRIPRAG